MKIYKINIDELKPEPDQKVKVIKMGKNLLLIGKEEKKLMIIVNPDRFILRVLLDIPGAKIVK